MAEPQAPQLKNEGDVPDLSGTMVGRFAIRSRLGAGGMGEVYRADDTRLKRPVALKRIAPQLRADEDYRSYFVKEAERASALIDPHIASVYDVLEENGETFLVMEYVEGQTLRQRLNQPLNLKEFLPLVVQCAEALVAAHEKGIVHRDIKPENLMVTPKGQLKILDFGVAKRVPGTDETITADRTATAAAPFAGTPAYMAPEALLEKEIDGRADIFSLGVILYEVLAGRHPFRADTFTATSDRILHAVPAPLAKLNPEVPAELERIVAKMLAKDPAERHATARDLLVDLRAVQRAILYPPLHVTLPPQRAKRRRALIAAGLAVVALVLLSVGLWNFFRLPPPTERIRVAVLPFANQTGIDRLEQYQLTLTDMLVWELRESPNIRVLPYEELWNIVRGFETKGEDISSPEAIQALADYSNSEFVVVPRMIVIGSTLRVQAEFWDASAGETVGGAKAERALSGSAEDVFYSMLAELGGGIQEYFKEAGRGEDYRPRPPGSRPKTMAAAFHLNKGRNDAAQGNYAQALNSFQLAIDEDPGFALAYAWMGHIYGLLGYDDKARELSEEAYKKIRAETSAIDAFFIEANLAERKYDYAAAEEKYRDLIERYPDEAVWRVRLGEVYEKQGQYQKAIPGYQEALSRDSTYIIAYQKLGSLYRKTGDYAQAISHAEKALSLYRTLGNREGEAAALVDLGEILRLKGDYGQAREYGQSALELFKELGNEFGVIQATRHLGNIRFHEGNLKEARRYYQQVLSASGEIRNNRLIVSTLMNMGVTYHREGDWPRAVEYYERSVAEELPALRERALAMTNLAAINIEYGPDPERGLQLAQEALGAIQMMGDTLWEARNRMLVGLYSMNKGQYEQAIDHFQQAQALSRSIEDKGMLALTTYNLGRCYFFQNEYQLALEPVASALVLFQDLQDPFGAAMARILLGWTYYRLGDTPQASSLLREGAKLAEENGYGELLPDAYNALGEVYRERGEKQLARDSFAQGSDLWKEPSVSESSIEARSHLGLLEAERGNLERGLSYCRRSVERARQLQHRHTLARTLINLARVHLLRKEHPRAIKVLGEITSLGEQDLGLELRAQAFYLRGRALTGLGTSEEAKASYLQAQVAIGKLQRTLSVDHRESFVTRRDIQVLLP